MRRRGLVLPICIVLILTYLTPVNIPWAHGSPSVSFKLTRVVWGNNPDSPIKAYPGDEGVALTVEVQNDSNYTITGVVGTLMLSDPFIDVYGNHNTTARGEPTELGDVMNQTGEILPARFFTLTFTLNIDPDALPGSYSYPMTLDYSIKSGNYWLSGEPKTLNITFILSKSPSTITCSVSPRSLEKGETIDVSGSLDPAEENLTITLSYRDPNGTIHVRNVTTDAEGAYSDSYQPEVEGTWSVNASWPGDERYEGDWASASFEVRRPVSFSVTTSNNRLVGGLDNEFNITLLNDGEVLLSDIDVTLNLPQPLILHGDNHLSFESLDPGDSIHIPLEIYIPETSIGSTYSGTLSLNYRDDYGDSHSETYPIGLIVRGFVELVVYGKIVNPQPARPGSRVSLAATLLNRGNVAAMFVNVSILPSQVLELTPESTAYVGEVEENSQTPFSLAAMVRPGVQNGTYPVTVSVTYQDDQHVDHVFYLTFHVAVREVSEEVSGSSGTGGLLGPLSEVWVVFLTLLLASAAVLFLYRRSLSRAKV